MSNLNGFELAGRNMKVNHVTERDTSAMETLDGEDTDGGVGMTPQSRAALMARLAEGHNTGGWLVPILGECYFLHCLSPLSLSLLLSLFSSPSRSDSTTATSSQCTKHTCHFVLFHAQQHVWPLPWEWPRLGQRHQRWCTGGMYAPWTSNAHLRWPLLTGKELYDAKLVV